MAIVKICAPPTDKAQDMRGDEIPPCRAFTFIHNNVCTFGMKSYNGDRIMFISSRPNGKQFVDGYEGSTSHVFQGVRFINQVNSIDVEYS